MHAGCTWKKIDNLLEQRGTMTALPVLAFLLSLFTACSASFPNEPGFDFQYRLPTDWQPIAYRLKIFYEESAVTIPAQVTIRMMAQRPTEKIVLNAFSPSIYIRETKIVRLNSRKFSTNLARPTATQQTITYLLPSTVYEQLDYGSTMDLQIAYTFEVNETYYYGPYRETSYAFNSKGLAENATRIDLFTQFEPFYTRRLFPCFDEPEYKALFYLERFEFRRKTASKAVVLFNTHGKMIKRVNDTEIWTFERPTPKMSPYLVAILVGNFEHFFTDGELGDNPPKVTFWYKKSVNLTESVLQSRRVIGQFERHFNIQSPLKKFDFAFVPFAFYGMENWGLIGMRNIFSLTGDNGSMASWSGESTLVHEIMHQWFGNIITCRWWTDIWINEGLTSYYTHEYLENVFKPTPEKRKIQREMVMYNYRDPIRLRRFGESWMNAYDKSPFILKMLKEVIGEEVFNKSINSLLDHYHYQSVTTDDFFRVFQREVDSAGIRGWEKSESTQKILDVRKFLYSWLFEDTFPTVTADWNNETKTFSFTQANSYGLNFYIPIWFSLADFSEYQSDTYWLTPKQDLKIRYEDVYLLPDDPTKVVFDPKVIGFYLVETTYN